MENTFNHTVDLEGCLIQVEASKEWFSRSVLSLSIDQLRWRPNPGWWSIAECLDHLNLTLDLYLPRIAEAIEGGWRNGGAVQGCSRLSQPESEALRRVEPPVTVRIPAAVAASIPSSPVDPDSLVERFQDTRDRYATLVRRASGLDLVRLLIAEPIHPPIQSLGGALAFLAAHDRRHVWQAVQVRNTPGFPKPVHQATTNTQESL